MVGRSPSCEARRLIDAFVRPGPRLLTPPSRNLVSSHFSHHACRGFHQTFRSQPGEEIQSASDQSGPSCLMAGSQTGAVLTMEVLIEQDVVPPMRIFLEILRSSIDR